MSYIYLYLVPIRYIASYNFLRQAVQKAPFFDFQISPYSFFKVLASFQLALTGNNKDRVKDMICT